MTDQAQLSTECIEDIIERAKRRWPIANMLLHIKTVDDGTYISTILREYSLELDPQNITFIFQCIDWTERMTPLWYHARNMHDNTKEMIAKYPSLCRWGTLRAPTDDLYNKFFVLSSKHYQQIAAFTGKNAERITDYFIAYEQWRQAIENVYRVLPLPIAEEIGKFMFFWQKIFEISRHKYKNGYYSLPAKPRRYP